MNDDFIVSLWGNKDVDWLTKDSEGSFSRDSHYVEDWGCITFVHFQNRRLQRRVRSIQRQCFLFC